jgi:hypothetical protein
MRPILLLVTALIFLAAPLPAALGAEDDDEKAFSTEVQAQRLKKQVPRKPPAAAVKPPKPLPPTGYARPNRPDFDGKPLRPPFVGKWPPKPAPGFKPGRPAYKPPYNRPHRPPVYGHYNRYPPCPPHCGYTVYLDEYRDDYREEEKQTEYFQAGSEPPEEMTYFQGGGNFERFERVDEEPAMPPTASGEDAPQMDLESYRLMMKAWQ